MVIDLAEIYRVSETMDTLEWNGIRMSPTSTVNPAPAAAEATLVELIYEKLAEMRKRLDRLEELQKKCRWPRRRRRRGRVRCHRCQQPGHIARRCRAPVPIPAGRRQPSVTASPAPEIDARDSAVPTVAVERDKRLPTPALRRQLWGWPPALSPGVSVVERDGTLLRHGPLRRCQIQRTQRQGV